MRDVFGWLKTRERKVLLITVAAQLVILVAMIALRAIPLVTGQTVLVKVAPVDPRDLFRGDYVILSYDFSRVSQEQSKGYQMKNAGAGRSSRAGPSTCRSCPTRTACTCARERPRS